MPHFVYLLRCADKTLYCGRTTDIERRVKEHNLGLSRSAKYTRARRPVKLEYYETYESLGEALSREYLIKKLSRNQKEVLIATSQ